MSAVVTGQSPGGHSFPGHSPGGRPTGETADPGARAGDRTAAQVWRSSRLPLLVVGLLLVAAAALALSNAGQRSGALDPQATDPSGSKALAVLLAARGVTVQRVVGTGQAVDQLAGSGTLLVTVPAEVPDATLRRLAALGPGIRIVLLDPDAPALRRVTTTITEQPGPPLAVTPRDAGCGLAAAATAGRVELGGTTYDGGEQRCYDATLVTGHTPGGAELVVLGAPDPLTNDRLGQQGNAALGLSLLGGSGAVRWALPGGSDLAGAPSRHSLLDVLPRWVGPVALELLLAGLLLALWRGRRFGPLVAEPLPVVVRAAETVEGRGRLYRRAGARDSAAQALREGALHQIRPALGLGRTADATDDERSPAAVVAAVAARTGRPAEGVGAILYGPVPADDSGLVALAGSLDDTVRATVTERSTPEGTT